MALWMVRAGKAGQDEEMALERDVAVIGWPAFPDVSDVRTREDMVGLHEKILPEKKPSAILNLAGQLWAFRERIQEGDLVALPLKKRSAIAIGKVVGPYEFRTDLEDRPRHARRVGWINKDIPRASFDIDLLQSLGAAMTICQIKRNNAEVRIRTLLAGGSSSAAPTKAGEAGEATEEPAYPEDLETYARDVITKFVGKTYREHELSRLVAALLRAEGYQATESPAGPDGGVDIVAGQGPMGFDPPRICVQVKSSDYPLDVKPLRELQGVMKNFGAQQGLLVAWGGFKQSVYNEGRRLFFEIRLWDAEDVVRQLLQHYERLPDDLQAEIPLKRVWTLVPEDST